MAYFTLTRSDCFQAMIALYLINNRFYGGHIKEEEAKQMKLYLEKYLKLFFFSLVDSISLLCPESNFLVFLNGKDATKTENHFIFMEFYNKAANEKLPFEYIPIKFQGIRQYIVALKVSAFWEIYKRVLWPSIMGKL
jgi:hypothetical protein